MAEQFRSDPDKGIGQRGGSPRSGRWLWRAGAAGVLVCILAVLYWGAFGQDARPYPFYAPDLPAWFLEKMPHPGHGTMPVVPAGSLGGFVPRGLCANAEAACAGLEIADDGRALLRREGRIETLARVRHTRTTGYAFAVGSTGELWQLIQSGQLTWSRIKLSPLEAGYEKSGGVPQALALAGHTGEVYSAAFSPDGTRVVTASDDQTARLWDAATGKALATLEGHTAGVRSAAFSPDGTRVVTASDDQTARLWDAATGKALATLEGHTAGVRSAAFSPDGTRVVTASDDQTARLWDAATGKALATLEGHTDSVWSAAFSPDGTRVVTASFDHTARLWDAALGKAFATLAGHTEEVSSAAFSPDGTRVVTASFDHTARLWDAATGKALATLEGHTDAVSSAAFSPDGTRVVTASLDKTARLWDAATGKALATLAGHTATVSSAAFSPDGTRVVTASHDGNVRIWRVASMVAAAPIVTDVAVDAAQTLWVVGRHGYAAVGDTGDLQPVPSDTKDDLLAIASLSDGLAMAVGTSGTVVRFERGQTGGATGKVPASKQTQQQQAPQQAHPQPAIAHSLPIQEAHHQALRAVFFADEKHGWVAGDDGLLLYTEDGPGQHWKVLHEGGGYQLTDVYVQSGLGWAVGETPDGHRVVLASDKPAEAQSWRELPHYVAPWWFFLGVPGFVLAGFLNVWAWRLELPRPEASITGAGISDLPLTWRDPDARVLRPLARGLSRFLRNVNTEPPLTIAITGRWGSGKSSLMNLLQEDLRQFGARPVWFNAWHHREEEHLLVALFAAVRRHGPPGWWLDRGLAFRLRLLWLRSRTAFVNLFYLLLFAAIAAITVHWSLPWLGLPETEELLRRVAAWLDSDGELSNFVRDYGGAILSSGGLMLAGLWLRGKMVALPANPAKLVAAVARRASIGDFSDKLSFRDRFGEQFSEVCQALRTRTSPGLVILVDDLDRCPPEDTLKILEAVNYFVSAGPCIVILGMDRRQVEYCVGLGFEKLVEGLPEDELLYEDELVRDSEGRVEKIAKQRAFARHYLEKLVNVEVPVPARTGEQLDAMLIPPQPEPRDTRGEDRVAWWRRLVAAPGRRAEKPSAVGKEVNNTMAPTTDPPGWLYRLKFGLSTAAQVARVGVLAFVLAWLLVWSVEKVHEWPAPEVKRHSTETSTETPSAQSSNELPRNPAIASGPQPESKLARIPEPEVSFFSDIPSGRRWVWWSPTVLVLLVAVLWGVGTFMHRERRVVDDSPDFRKALAIVRPLLEEVNPTPRAIKRYQNRMRYLAERLRPQDYEPDAIDSFLHWLGGRLKRSIVPDAWFEDTLRTAISEPALILLGAIETFAPRAFEQPAEEALEWLDREADGDPRAQRRANVWRKVREDFRKIFPEAKYSRAWPSAEDVRAYKGFSQSGTRGDVARGAASTSSSRHPPRPGPVVVAHNPS